MDIKEIRSIEDQASSVLKNIKQLEQQISSYRDGSEAFEKASEALVILASAHESLIESLKQSVTKLEKIDIVSLVNKVDELSTKLDQINEKITAQIANINTTLDAGVTLKKKRLFRR